MLTSLIDIGKCVGIKKLLILRLTNLKSVKNRREKLELHIFSLYSINFIFDAVRYHRNALHSADTLRLPYTRAYSRVPIAAYHILNLYGMPIRTVPSLLVHTKCSLCLDQNKLMYNETCKFKIFGYTFDLTLPYTVIVIDVYGTMVVNISLIIYYTTKLLVYIAIFKKFY